MQFSAFHMLRRAAESYPDTLAFTDADSSATFMELYRESVRIGTAVASAVARNAAVAVLTRHKLADVAAFYGVLYAGCYYVPIDAEAPPEYVQARIDSVKPALVLDPSATSRRASDSTVDEANADPATRRYEQALPNDPAYAIFTSGSTGSPKAAVIPHQAVWNLTRWLCEEFRLDGSTVFASQTPFYFDASVTEIYCTPYAGATTHIMPQNAFFSPLKVVDFLNEHRVNTLEWATAAFKLIANSKVFEKRVPQYLTTIMFGGESLTGKHLNIWRKAIPQAMYVNLYGPSETTVDCAFYVVDREFGNGESIPIGRAIDGAELLLLDGQIAVRGIGVALGYCNDRARSESRFVQNPQVTAYRDVVYLTGDLAEYNAYGELVYLGRADSQVKHMGARVSLDEIENGAVAVAGVALAAAVFDAARDRITLFYSGDAEEPQVAQSLERVLPRYSRPNAVRRLDALPKLPNGKLDRARIWEIYADYQ
ncbi:MAG: AMP-binding protein [Oscillospiraceae bacterium]|jgi:amino acid adenylation domain-containing protein|nr:AMP-binding protein [Oscillospiraceae bacterium]